MKQLGLFDWENRYARIDKGGDPLVKLNKVINWDLSTIAHKSTGEGTQEQRRSEAIRCGADVQEPDHPVAVQPF